MRTTQALKSLGQKVNLFVANNCDATYEKIVQSHQIDNLENDSLQNLLFGKWSNISFHAAYLDLCTGSSHILIDIIKALLLNSSDSLRVLGVTITKRDPTGETMTARIHKMEEEIVQGAKMIRVQDMVSGVKWTHAGVVTLFYLRPENHLFSDIS